MTDLFNSVKDLKSSTKDRRLFGSLGIPLDGRKLVEVPTRSGFVYVRLRDSTSEVIQAQNDTVSPIYDLPVELYRRGNKYAIKGRDTERYQDWGTYSPFLPRHGEQHSFNPEAGGGGDVSFIFGKQFMPMLTSPSGSNGSGNVLLNEYVLQDTTIGWKYTGNTGTANLLNYKPTNGDAVMILVYLDQTTGNPGIIVGSGSYFSNAVTGTAQVTPFIPPVSNSNYLPSFAVRLSSGTSIIGWDNLYDVRQYYSGGGVSSSPTGSLTGIPVQDEGTPVGTGTVMNFVGPNVDVSVSGSVIRVFVTGSSGSSLPTFITGSVPYAGSNGTLKEDNPRFLFDEQFGTLWLGKQTFVNITTDQAIRIRPTGTNASAGIGIIVGGTGTSGSPVGYYNGYRCRGTIENPTAVMAGDALVSMLGFGYDGANWDGAGRFRMYANTDWNGSNFETRMDWDITPSGSTTRRTQMSLYGDSLNLTNTGTYNVNGTPHTHRHTQLTEIGTNTHTQIDTFISQIPAGAVYNPTVNNTSNLDSTPVVTGVFYKRIGDYVTLFGAATGVDPTATGLCSFDISLPISSNFTASKDASGLCGRSSNATEMGLCQADATNDVISVSFQAIVTVSHTLVFQAQFVIK